ncbi:hypothetical protein [Colwellia sp. KU-HH00111]|uniref:hypothetical protein n=1 Tax=Colwellia sp. KU-HH00111 TaxID=3127652 RepID=UPI00336554A8
MGIGVGLAFDAVTSYISGTDNSSLTTVANAAGGEAVAATLPTQKKPRTGAAGGGPSKDKTSVASKYNHSAYQNKRISLKQWHLISKLLRRFPYLGLGLSFSELVNALYERYGKEAVDKELNSNCGG